MATGNTTAELGYLEKLPLYQHEKPFQIFIPIEEGDRQTNLEFEPKEQDIIDVRPIMDTFKLDVNGFEIRRRATAVTFEMLQNDDNLKSLYLPEIAEELRFIEGGYDRVFFFDWRVRTSDPNKHDTENKVVDINARASWLDPVTRVHIDQSPRSVVHRINLQLGSDAPSLLQGRVRIIKYEAWSRKMQELEELMMCCNSAWRPLGNPVHEWPLALCDGATMPQSDLVECDHVRRRFKGSAYYAYYNPAHKWYYLGEQSPDEVTFLKIFDSDPSVQARNCPHTAFKHPNSPSSCPARQSIEVRALVFNNAPGISQPTNDSSNPIETLDLAVLDDEPQHMMVEVKS